MRQHKWYDMGTVLIKKNVSKKMKHAKCMHKMEMWKTVVQATNHLKIEHVMLMAPK